ncbi:hypothetical protein K435DRAFT_732098 [Dendrothele bispora CBS 962.96]|uniref:Transferase n=1 Tax=Dendrothele bispora (strain CBS 962.96) TaxID=1314807 RepID=A0A4S8LA48_DENBC|nr:hypothetical protein K435DRAFT_732098 [Dendrothele bispora CBS 962.96]
MTQPAIKTSSERVFPLSTEAIKQNGPFAKSLSVVDATVLRYSPASATWLFDGSEGTHLSIDVLVLSLRRTLDSYPQWSGYLHMPIGNDHPSASVADHTKRFNRPMLTWGTSADPGVEVIQAKSPHRLAELIPSCEQRASRYRVWDGRVIASMGIFPESPNLALYDRVTCDDLPCVIVQLTTFACGGLAITVKLAHVLADAQTLLTFVHDWATQNRWLVGGAKVEDVGIIERPFQPELVNRAADGDIDVAIPDEKILAKAKSIPLHRYDWWASADDCPSFMLKSTEIPDAIKTNQSSLSFGKPMPWRQWDILAPVSYYLVHFSREEVIAMWEASVTTTISQSQTTTSSPPKISKLDALFAHLWTLVIRARGLSQQDFDVHLDTTIGLRPRLSPPLPSHFIGSPIINIPVSLPASKVVGPNAASAAAAAIRESMNRYDSSTLETLLYEMAYEVDPSRRWNTFLGERHTIATSWLESRPGMGIYDVDFGFGRRPRLAESLMPECDGCIQVMESGVSNPKDVNEEISGATSRKFTPWYENGVAVSLHLRTDVMDKVLADTLLRRYDVFNNT